jgi:hypothetical protein
MNRRWGERYSRVAMLMQQERADVQKRLSRNAFVRCSIRIGPGDSRKYPNARSLRFATVNFSPLEPALRRGTPPEGTFS